MPTLKLTDAAVQRLKAPPGQRVDYFDAAFPGLALRVTGAVDQRPERRTWTFFYRIGGRQRRLTFEPGYPALSLAEARAAATQALLQIKAGIDPAEVKAAAKEKAARAPDTIGNVVESFIRLDLERRKRAPRYINDVRRIFTNHVLPRWADRDIRTIARRDVIELLDAIMDTGSVVKGTDGNKRKLPGGPVIANRTLAAVRAMFNWALRRGIIEATPAAMVEAPGEETARARVLNDGEIAAVWAAASTLGYPFGPFFQLTLVLAQRREEIARMQWDQIDLVAATWTLPTSKSARAHVVPLAPAVTEILSALPRKPGRFVFTTSGDTPISGFSKAKARLDQAMVQAGNRLEPWTIHDLRRTAATGMGRLSVSRFIIGKVLNHADRTVTGIYDRHAYLEEKRHALNAWASNLEGLTHRLEGNMEALAGESDLPLLNVKDLNDIYAPLYILAAMFFPNPASMEHKQYVEAAKYEAVANVLRNRQYQLNPAEIETVAAVALGPRLTDIGKMIDCALFTQGRLIRPDVAAWLFLYVLGCAASGDPAKASKERAYKAFEQAAHRAKLPDRSRATLVKIYDDFEPAVHLWAARAIHCALYEGMANGGAGVADFLGAAEYLRIKAEHVLLDQRPLQRPDRAWRAPHSLKLPQRYIPIPTPSKLEAEIADWVLPLDRVPPPI